MKKENILRKFMEEKFKSFIRKTNKYTIDDALEILENDYYEDIDLFIWIETNEPIVFDTKDDAIEYINTYNPNDIFIEFSEYLLLEEAANNLADYIIDTDEINEEQKINIIKLLIDDYLNKSNENDENVEMLEYVKSLSDFEIFDMISQGQLLYVLVSDFSEFYDNENRLLYVEPNKNFFEEKNIYFINEICLEFLTNFHNYNFTNGYLDNESIELIYKFLCSKFILNDEYYEYYFGKHFYDKEKFNKILILMVISEYYKIIIEKKNEQDFLRKDDINNLNLIQKFSPQKLIFEFETNESFGLSALSDFLYFNNTEITNENKNSEVQKTLKKIDPFYPLNKRKNI